MLKTRITNLHVFVFCVLIVVGISLLWIKVSSLPINYQRPVRPSLPKPNAYDTYVKAADNMVCSAQINEAGSSIIPSTSSNMSGSLPGMPGMPGLPGSGKANMPLPPGVPPANTLNRLYNLSEKQAVVRANTKALNIYRKGLEQPYLLPKFDSQSFPEYSAMRELARLISLESSVYRDQGENGKAINNCIDGLHFGNSMANGGNLLSGFVSIAIQAIVRKNAWDIVDRLNLPDTKTAVAKLEAVNSKMFSFTSIIKEEKDSSLSLYSKTLNSADWRTYLLSDDDTNNGASTSFMDSYLRFKGYIRSFQMSRRGLFNGLEDDYNRMIEASRLTYPESLKTDMSASNILSEEIVPFFDKARCKYEYNRCLNEILLLQLALHAYKLEHGSYPAKLNALSPNYISILPLDPFTKGDHFKYSLTSKGYLLYSIGPDLKDNGGKAVVNKSNPKARWVELGDKGDIVAGYNR